MSKAEVPLSEDEVRQISRIIDTLNHSTFDYLQLEFGALKLTIGKGAQVGAPSSAPAPTPVAASVAAPAAVQRAARQNRVFKRGEARPPRRAGDLDGPAAACPESGAGAL